MAGSLGAKRAEIVMVDLVDGLRPAKSGEGVAPKRVRRILVRVSQDRDDRVGERSWILGWNEETDIVPHDLLGAAGGGCDDRRPACESLDEDGAEALGSARQDDRSAFRHQSGDLGVRLVSHEGHPIPEIERERQAAQLLLLEPRGAVRRAPDEHEPCRLPATLEECHRPEKDVDPLDVVDPAHVEDLVGAAGFAGADPEHVSIDTDRDDRHPGPVHAVRGHRLANGRRHREQG